MRKLDNAYVVQIPSTHMENPDYSLIVYPYLLGEFQIQLRHFPQSSGTCEPPIMGPVVWEFYTHHINSVWWILHRLASHKEPLKRCFDFSTPEDADQGGVRKTRLD